MRRLQRLGTVAFITAVLGLVFHLLATLYNGWSSNTCNTCNATDIFSSWQTGLYSRCYEASMASMFLNTNDTTIALQDNTFRATICIPNLFLYANAPQYANICLADALANPDIVCSTGMFNTTACHCDYTLKIQAGSTSALLAIFSLGILLFLSHVVTYITKDRTLRWMIPLCFTLSLCSIVLIVLAISIVGSNLDEDVVELRYSWAIRKLTFQDPTAMEQAKQQMHEEIKQNYTVKIAWCYALEIMTLYFASTSLVIYALMFFAKQRPESENKPTKK